MITIRFNTFILSILIIIKATYIIFLLYHVLLQWPPDRIESEN